MLGRRSNIQTNFFDANQVVEPGRSDKAAFDPDTYYQAMRDGRDEGLVHYVAAFLGGGVIGLVASFGASPSIRATVAFAVGVSFVIGLTFIRRRRVRRNMSDAVKLHAQAHELEALAVRLEIEKAKASGAFDKWDKAQ